MKKPTDATIRNIRASKKRDDWIKLRLIELEARVKVLEKRVKALEKALSKASR